jgi:hypothetical protein
MCIREECGAGGSLTSWGDLSFLVGNRKCMVFQVLCSACTTALALLGSPGRIEPFWLYKHHSLFERSEGVTQSRSNLEK